MNNPRGKINILTLKDLKDMSPGIFAQGMVIDAPGGCNVANTGEMIKWVAVRGRIHDWTIYTDNPYSPQPDYEGVRSLGDKITGEENIKNLVPCDDEAFVMYRY
jgi:hypothetical protein